MSRRAARRDRALVLRRHPYGETSLVLRLLTPEHGKVALLAKGAYRARSAYAGVFDLFDTLVVEWRPARFGELGTAVRAHVAERRRGVTRDLGRYRAALAILELCDLAAQPAQAEPDLFALVEARLDALARGAVEPGLALVAFDLAFLQNLGLAPALTGCASCGAADLPAPRSGDVPFDVAAGGRLCDRCAASAGAGGRRVGRIPMHLLKIAASLAAARAADLGRIRMTAAQLAGVARLVQRFLDHHLETRPRSRAEARGVRA